MGKRVQQEQFPTCQWRGFAQLAIRRRGFPRQIDEQVKLRWDEHSKNKFYNYFVAFSHVSRFTWIDCLLNQTGDCLAETQLMRVTFPKAKNEK